MEFYSVKHREKVNVPDDKIKKKKFNSDAKGDTSKTRYAVVAREFEHKGDKINLTKFVSKNVYESLTVPEEK